MTARTLRDYQEASVTAVSNEFDRVGSSLLVLPTGCGKTVVMAKLAAGWQRGNVLLLAHRIELLDQAADKLGSELGYRPVIEQAQRGIHADCVWQGGMVLVASIQTLINPKRRSKFDQTPFDLILIDEAHRAISNSYQTLINYFRAINPHLKVLGVTATPNRSDGTALGIVFDSVAYHMPILDAVEGGWLVPIRQEFVSVANINFENVRLGKNDLQETDLRASDLEEVLLEEEALHAFARPLLDRAGDRQGVVFASGVAHAHQLASVLCRYKVGCAKAIDGKTDTEERKQAVEDYAAGKLQFLVNFGIFCEGFDSPITSVIAMGRPTKSVGLYTQMLGRGTRPLPGVVDGPPTPELRRAAIRGSIKPDMLVIDYVGNSRHKLVSSLDVLGGNYDLEVRELARKQIEGKPGAEVAAQLKKARAEMLLLAEQERRRAVKAQVEYSTHAVDPFGHDAAPGRAELVETRGGSTDGQIGLLVNLGVSRETAAGFGRKQASAVIEDLKSKRCTNKQRSILARYGENPDVNFDQARAVIDQIAANGWRARNLEAAS